jgi:hypothetical protein
MKLRVNKKNATMMLRWDKKEQAYIEQNSRIGRIKESDRDVESYFNFLSDLQPLSEEPAQKKMAEKQFTF